MKKFPQLKESSFLKTREQYHLIAKLIGKVRETLVKPIAKNDNLWFSVVDKGFCMPPIESINELEVGCNMETMKIDVTNSKDYKSIGINGMSIDDICKELNKVLNDFGVNTEIDFSNLVHSGVTRPQAPAWGRDALNISEKDSIDFLTQFYNFHWLLKEFHSRIREGVKTQICLWPHHFDNVFKWFTGKKVNEQDEQACLTEDAVGRQVGIGVSNGDSSYTLPYIYMTFGSPLRTTNRLEIIDGAILHDSDWTGLTLPYEAIESKAGINEQKKLVEDFFNTSFSSVKIGFSKR